MKTVFVLIFSNTIDQITATKTETGHISRQFLMHLFFAFTFTRCAVRPVAWVQHFFVVQVMSFRRVDIVV